MPIDVEEDYRLESYLGSAEALIQDVQRSMTRSAVKGGVTPEAKRDMFHKLRQAADYISKLPERKR